MDALVSTDWLAEQQDASDLRIVDATYHALDATRDAAAEYEAEHIPGAVYMDLANLNDSDDPLPGMLPRPEKFASRMQALGLGDGSRIVLYDTTTYHTAARAWWMLRLFGATEVAILDGGMKKWKAEGRPTSSGRQQLGHRHFTVSKDDNAVRSLQQMKDNLQTGAEQVLDARSAGRFTGQEPDPRGLASGHIPGSKNLPYARLFNPDGTWKRGDALKAEFAAEGIDMARPLVTTCGSGITAAVLLFGAHLLGKSDVAVYDGSWSEWGQLPDTEKATGTA